MSAAVQTLRGATPRLQLVQRLDRHRLAMLLVSPALMLVFGLVLYPVAYDLALSLTDATGFTGPGKLVGLSNFGALLQDEEFRRAARNSLVYTLFTATIRLVLGLAMALALWRMHRGRSVVFIALFIAWVFPATLSAFAFYWLLSPPFHTFYTLPLLELRWALANVVGEDIWNVASIAFHDVWRSAAFVAIFLLAGLNSLPSDQLDYAKLECSSPVRRFRFVVLPMLRRFLVLAVLLSVVMSFIDYTGVYLETGGRVTWPLLGTLAYQESFLNGRTALGSAMTLIQLPVWLGVLWFGFRWIEREPSAATVREESSTLATPYGVGSRWDKVGALLLTDRAKPRTASRHDTTAGSAITRAAVASHHDTTAESAMTPAAVAAHHDTTAGSTMTRARAWRRTLSATWIALAALAIIAFAIFPIWWIFLQAVRPVSEDPLGNPFWTWSPTFNGFTAAVRGRLIGVWLLNTFIILVLGISLTLATSALAGYALGRLRVPGGRWLARLLFASYFLPYPMLLVPVYQIFVWLHLDNSLLAVILLNQTLTIPFATWLCFSYFQGLPADIEEHARLDGSSWDVFRHIALPMSWPVLIAVGIFSAGIMASDVIYAGLLLVHDDMKTIAVGLGLIGISLNEFDTISGGIGMAAAPLVAVCAAFAPAYVRGLSAAMVEGA